MPQEIGELIKNLKEENSEDGKAHRRASIGALIAALAITASVYIIPRDYRAEESLIANIKRNIAEVATNIATNMGGSGIIMRRGVDKAYLIEYDAENNAFRLSPY